MNDIGVLTFWAFCFTDFFCCSNTFLMYCMSNCMWTRETIVLLSIFKVIFAETTFLIDCLFHIYLFPCSNWYCKDWIISCQFSHSTSSNSCYSLMFNPFNLPLNFLLIFKDIFLCIVFVQFFLKLSIFEVFLLVALLDHMLLAVFNDIFMDFNTVSLIEKESHIHHE